MALTEDNAQIYTQGFPYSIKMETNKQTKTKKWSKYFLKSV